ncbi:hypothetical protein PP713_08555 [Mycobacterium sp. CSUR Q5927]|nr:hypothetical protein [Mycobacterium sp. CSUR Q5927]
MVLIAAAGQAEELSNAGFWGAVGLAAAIATALATAASTATAIWWRYQDRTEAEWSVRLVDRGGSDNMGSRVSAPQVRVVIQNIGDGVAHQVCVSGALLASDPWVGELETSPNRPRREAHQPIPALRTGDSIYVAVKAESFDVWDRATVEVTWWPPPTRKKKDWWIRSRQRTKRFPLKDITDPPSDLPGYRGLRPFLRPRRSRSCPE